MAKPSWRRLRWALLIGAFLIVSIQFQLLPRVSEEVVHPSEYQSYLNRFDSNAKQTFFLCWTTPPDTFRERHRASLESLLLQHPEASFRLYSSTLPPEWPLSYQNQGYDITIESLDFSTLSKLSKGLPEVEEWLLRYDEWSKGPYFYSHITDLLRLTALYQWGGSWTDLDALWLSPSLTLPSSSIGLDSAVGSDWCGWCLPPGDRYAAPGVMLNFPPQSLTLRRAISLAYAPQQYDPQCWVCAGPYPLTKAISENLTLSPQEGGVTLLDSFTLYPLSWQTISTYFNATEDTEYLFPQIRRNSVSLHLYGHITKELDPHPLGVVGKVLEEYGWPCIHDNGLKWVGLPSFVAVAHSLFPLPHLRFVDCSQNPTERYTVTLSTQNAIMWTPEHDTPVSFWKIQGNLLEVHRLLSRLALGMPDVLPRDLLTITLSSYSSQLSSSFILYNLSLLVTMAAKTYGRMHLADQLITSVRRHYPLLPIVISDDGFHTIYPKDYPTDPHLRFLKLPFDTGLSQGRNEMMSLISTPYFLLLDDDFEVDVKSDVGLLVHILEQSDFDLLGFLNPEDKKRWGFHFHGLMRVSNSTLILESGSYGTLFQCEHVDFVPNLFVGRTSRIRKLGWDSRLKLGEHEEFFLRAKRSQLKVGSCPMVAVKHRTTSYWLERSGYDLNRKRVKLFFEWALFIMNLTRLEAFGTLQAQLLPGHLPQSPICPFGWTGPSCQRCSEGFKGVDCSECQEGYSGLKCEKCHCLHGGTCQEGRDGGGCHCPDGFFGVDCSVQLGKERLENPEFRENQGRVKPWWNNHECCSTGTSGELICKNPQGIPCSFSQIVVLSQDRPRLLVGKAMVKASVLNGPADATFSLLLDVTYVSGSRVSRLHPFTPGESSWQSARFEWFPDEAVAKVDFLLFSQRRGNYEWRNVSLRQGIGGKCEEWGERDCLRCEEGWCGDNCSERCGFLCPEGRGGMECEKVLGTSKLLSGNWEGCSVVLLEGKRSWECPPNVVLKQKVKLSQKDKASLAFFVMVKRPSSSSPSHCSVTIKTQFSVGSTEFFKEFVSTPEWTPVELWIDPPNEIRIATVSLQCADQVTFQHISLREAET